VEGSTPKEDDAVKEKLQNDVEVNENSLNHATSAVPHNNLQIRRLERRLSDLDHKLDLLIACVAGRSHSPSD